MSSARSGAAAGATDHSRMHGGATANASGRSAATGHAAMGHGAAAAQLAGSTSHAAMGHDAPRPAVPTDRATDKLLTLVGELVRDPAVQAEIREDPALREAWEDPGVRRVVTRQP